MDWTKVCTIYLYSIYKWSAAAWRHDYHCFFPFHSRGFKKDSLGRRHYSIYTRNQDLAWRSSAVWDAKINNRGSSDYADFGFDKKVVQISEGIWEEYQTIEDSDSWFATCRFYLKGAAQLFIYSIKSSKKLDSRRKKIIFWWHC